MQDFNFDLLLTTSLAVIIPLFWKVLFFAIIIFIGLFVSKYAIKLLRGVFEKSNVDLAAASFISSVLKSVIMIITLIIAISELGLNLDSAITALGAAGLTASFALQGSLSNFVSGIQLVFAKPFKVNDFLSVGSESGSVKEITILNTTLLTADNKEVIIPNSMMTTGIVVNFTSQSSRRLDLSYGIDYSSDLDLAKKIVEEVALNCELVLKENAPVVAVGKHQDSSVEIIAQVWIEPANYWKAYFYMQENVKKSFDKNNITIPFPQLDVHSVK
ncbi:MAG: mechanosensitive ion channel family protein [Clostridia bacterium]